MESSIVSAINPYVTNNGNWRVIDMHRGREFKPVYKKTTQFWSALCKAINDVRNRESSWDQIEIRHESEEEVTCNVDLFIPFPASCQQAVISGLSDEQCEFAQSACDRIVPLVQRAIDSVYTVENQAMLHAVTFIGSHGNLLVIRVVTPMIVIQTDTIDRLESQIRHLLASEKVISSLIDADLVDTQRIVSVRRQSIVSPTISINDSPIGMLRYYSGYIFTRSSREKVTHTGLDDIVVLHEHDLIKTRRVKFDQLDEVHDVNDLEFWLPLLLYGYTRQITSCPISSNRTYTPALSYNDELNQIAGITQPTGPNVAYYSNLLQNIREEYRQGAYFAKIGYALSSETYGDEAVKQVWIDSRSEQCELSPDALDKIWQNGVESEQYTMRTLRYMIRWTDAFTYYNLIAQDMANACRTYQDDNATAHCIHIITRDIAQTYSISHTRCYSIMDNNGTVKTSKTDDILRQWIHKELPIICNILEQVIARVQCSLSHDDQDRVGQAIKNIRKCISVSSRFNSVWTIYSKLIYNYDAGKLIDTCVSYTYNKNTVLEVIPHVDESRVYVRLPLPEDYVTMTTGIVYPASMHGSTRPDAKYQSDKYNINHPKVQSIINWINQMTGDQEITDLLLTLEASVLSGTNMFKKYVIWTGSLGNNGKTTLKTLIESTIGEYNKVGESSIVTEKKSGQGSHNAALAHAKGGKTLFIQETDHRDDELRAGSIKLLSGLDRIYARNFHGSNDTAEFVMRALPHLICNDLPAINDPDTAIENRLVIIEFVGTWRDDAPDSLIKQKQMRVYKSDPSWIKNISHLKGAFMWLLCYYYDNYVRGNTSLRIPEKVKATTSAYIRRNRTFSNFAREHLEFEENARVNKSKIIDMYREYLQKKKMRHSSDYSIENEINRYLKSAGDEYVGVTTKSNSGDELDLPDAGPSSYEMKYGRKVSCAPPVISPAMSPGIPMYTKK